MNNTVDPDSSATPVPTARWRRWGRRLLKSGLWSGVSLLLLLALAWQWINWSGARRLAVAKTQLEAAGETLDIRELFPDPVPDELNFCAVPALRDLALVVKDDPSGGEPARKRDRLKALALPKERDGKPRPNLPDIGRPLDAAAWLEWLNVKVDGDASAPSRLLQALDSDTELINELIAASDRPLSQWTPAWKEKELPSLLLGIQMPHYGSSMTASRFFALRASAAAQCGEAVSAHQSARVALRLAEASSEEPMLIGMMLFFGQMGQAREAIWEICHKRMGGADDFRRLEIALGKFDHQVILLHAYRSEFCLIVQGIEWVKANGMHHLVAMSGDTQPQPRWYLRVPGGWLDANAASVIERYLRDVLEPLRDHPTSLSARNARQKAVIEGMGDMLWSSDCFARLVIPNLFSFEETNIREQCRHGISILACALERHALLHGDYPDSLTELAFVDAAPAPVDPCTGNTYRYERTGNGRYRLSSPGLDGKDGEGADDLIWEYP